MISAASFSRETSWAFVDVKGQGKLGYADGTLVQFRNATVIEMSEALVPEHAESIPVQMMNV